MVAKCYHSADIILDQAGEGLVIGGGDAGLQPVTVGGGQQAGVNIEDQFGGVAPLSKDGKAALVAAQQVAGGAFGLLRGLRLLPDGGFGLADGGGADVRERNASTSPKSRAAMATARESMSLRGMEPPPFAAILVVVWPYCGGIVITGRKFKK